MRHIVFTIPPAEECRPRARTAGPEDASQRHQASHDQGRRERFVEEPDAQTVKIGAALLKVATWLASRRRRERFCRATEGDRQEPRFPG